MARNSGREEGGRDGGLTPGRAREGMRRPLREGRQHRTRAFSKRPSVEEVEQILRHVIGRIRRNWPAVEIMVRGDSHFATPEVMDLLEEKRCGYIFGLIDQHALDRDRAPLERGLTA